MRLLITLFLIIFSSITLAMGSSTKTNTEDANFRQAQELIDKKQYNKAIPLLKQVITTQPDNADANNYLGYSYRELGNLEEALKYYEQALKIDPNHKGANEYLGELYLMKGDLKKAEERLEVLNKACLFGCKEYTTLKERIEIFKKNVNHTVKNSY